MGFISKAFGGDDSLLKAQAAQQKSQLAQAQAAADAQSRTAAQASAKTAAAEDAMRRIRSPARRGLLAFTDDTTSKPLGA